MDKQYTVLHEIGDYFQGKDLSKEDNAAFNEQQNKKKKEKEKKDSNNK